MIVYLDNSATTRQYDEVTDLMADVAKNCYGNPSSLHGLGLEAEKLMKEGRRKIALGFNASPEEVYITSCGTEADNTVLMGLARVPRPKAKKIITTAVEHPAVLEPAQELERRGFGFIDCQFHTDHLESMGGISVSRDQYLEMLSKGITELKGI